MASRLPLSGSVLLPIALVMLVMLGAVSPVGDFPLNDDWVYADMVRALVEERTFYEHPYRGSLVVTLVGWGGLVASIFGFSYTVLRCSTLVLALVAVWATTRGALEHGLSRPLAFLCGALLLANPLFLNLAYTFMSDVPCLAAIACGGLFYLRALTRRSARAAFWGSTFVVMGSLTRQDGIVVIAAFLATEIVSWLRRAEKPDPRLLSGFASPLLLGWLFYMIAFAGSSEEAFNNLPEAAAMRSLVQLLPALLDDAASALTYMGLFTLPIVLAKLFAIARGQATRTQGEWIAVAGICLALQIATLSFSKDGISLRSMPLLPNVLYDLGTGPVTLRDVYALDASTGGQIGFWWWLVQLMALCSTALLLVDVVPSLARHVFGRRDARAPAQAENEAYRARTLFLALWIGAVVFLPYRLVTERLYDRYLLLTLFPVAILAVGSLKPAGRGARRTAWIGAGLAFVFSLFCVQDYLAWNTARWQAVDYLRFERGLGETEIDGGFEYNGSYLSAEHRKRYGMTSFWAQGPGRFWLLEETRYAVYMTDVPACEQLKDFPYFSWLRMETRSVFAVHCVPR